MEILNKPRKFTTPKLDTRRRGAEFIIRVRFSNEIQLFYSLNEMNICLMAIVVLISFV